MSVSPSTLRVFDAMLIHAVDSGEITAGERDEITAILRMWAVRDVRRVAAGKGRAV